MCKAVLIWQPESALPLLLGFNRDEFRDRASLAPGRHWPGHAGALGPADAERSGTWLAATDAGLVACVLNRSRRQSLGTDRRSRGELPLQALKAASVDAAASWAQSIRAKEYLGFRLVIAGREGIAVATGDGEQVLVERLDPGAHLVTSAGVGSPSCPRFLRHGRDIAALACSAPQERALLLARLLARPSLLDPKDGMLMDLGDYGTVSITIVAIPAEGPPSLAHEVLAC